MLSHKSVRITMDAYVRITPAAREEAARLLGEALFGPGDDLNNREGRPEGTAGKRTSR